MAQIEAPLRIPLKADKDGNIYFDRSIPWVEFFRQSSSQNTLESDVERLIAAIAETGQQSVDTGDIESRIASAESSISEISEIVDSLTPSLLIEPDQEAVDIQVDRYDEIIDILDSLRNSQDVALWDTTPDASITQRGLVNIEAQSFAGDKTFVGITKLGDGATNYTQFTATGHQTLHGSARTWRDEPGDLILKKTIGSRITDNVTEGTADFSDSCIAANDYKLTNYQFNHDRDETTQIELHIHWFQASANIPNLLLRYRWQVNGQAKDATWKNYKCNTPVYAYVSGILDQVCTGALLSPPATSGLSDILQVRVCRDTNNASTLFVGADPLTGDAALLYVDPHIQTNSLGSNDQYTK